jgi:hypothetical protein
VIVLLVPQLWEWTDGGQAPTQICKAKMSTSEEEEYLGRFAAAPWRTVYTAAKKRLENAQFAGVMENHARVEAQWVCTPILVDQGDDVLTCRLTRPGGTPTGRSI